MIKTVLAICPSIDCSQIPQAIIANPDIAGIGVIASFLITACIAISISILILLLEHPIVTAPNWLHRLFRCHKRSIWTAFLRKILLGFSDQQLVTGICIQISGFLYICDITYYHLRIVYATAFLSSVTHIVSLMILRDYFTRHRYLSLFRVVCVCINLWMLLATHWLSFRVLWAHESLGVKVVCFWTTIGDIIYWIVNVILIAFFTYVAIITIYPRLRKIMPLGLGAISRKWAIRFALLLLTGVFALASSTLQSTQALGRPLYPIDGDEAAWSFGQTLPLLFLSLPFLTALEVFSDECEAVDLRLSRQVIAEAVRAKNFTNNVKEELDFGLQPIFPQDVESATEEQTCSIRRSNTL